jgi:hypothetical protein
MKNKNLHPSRIKISPIVLSIIILLIIAVCLPNPLYAFDWYGPNQSTIGWDASPGLSDGNQVPGGDTISYRVYTRRLPGGADVFVADTTAFQYTLTFSVEGSYLAGVRTVRIPAGENGEVEVLSDIIWSDSLDVVAVPAPFGIRYFVKPFGPSGLGPR